MEIYIIRHGQSEANLSQTVQGTMDSPLTQLGRDQARSLLNLLPDFDHVFSSPLSRALDTALLATDLPPKSKKITLHKELMEIDFGELQGIKYLEVPFERNEIQKHVRFEKDVIKGQYKAELLRDFFHRTHSCFDKIIQTALQNNWQAVGIFSHGGFLRSILQYKLKLTEGRYENTEIAILTKINQDENECWNLERLTNHILR